MARLRPFGSHHTSPSLKGSGIACLRLIRSRRVGPATFHRLLAEHGSAEAALEALPGLARAAGIGDYSPCSLAAAHAELEAGHRAGARLLTWDDPAYPALLREIPEAPAAIWLRGDISVMARLPVAVIGARNASSLGLRMARGMALGLSQAGAAVVAGLARGIDALAHEAALDGGTIAVMAGGIDMIYPTENTALAESICGTGLLMTEQPPGTEAMARHFPARNRIISGLSRAVVVVEAAHRSGSLITAQCALDQGREVMAVPGHPMDARAGGCNSLIRDGATLVRNAADVLAALQSDGAAIEPASMRPPFVAPEPKSEPARSGIARALQPVAVARRLAAMGQGRQGTAPRILPAQGGPVDLETRILARLGPSPTEENLLIRDLGLPASAIAPALLELELAGRVQRMPGGRLARLG
jgi:DNA processing protein